MNSQRIIFNVCAIFVLCACQTSNPSDYIYSRRVTTGVGHAIVNGGVTVPIIFSEHSSFDARWSLCHLHPEIVDAADNQITVTGVLEEQGRSLMPVSAINGAEPEAVKIFRITDWKLKAPFLRYRPDVSDITNPPRIESRTKLLRSDFTSSKFFDPSLPAFDPSAHLVQK